MLKNKSFRDYLNKKILKDALIDSLKYQYYIHPSKIKKTRRLKRRKHELKGGSVKAKTPSKEQLDEWDENCGGKVKKEAKELMIPLMREWIGKNQTGTIEEWWDQTMVTLARAGNGMCDIKKTMPNETYREWWVEAGGK